LGKGHITKHANAKHSNVAIAKKKDKIILTIVDDGVGFEMPSDENNDGFGLFNIQQKIKHLGGSILFESGIGKGTAVTVTAPLFLVVED
jgi:signal transduction histidine kinase